MSRQWKPGDVAMMTRSKVTAVVVEADCGHRDHGYARGPHWHYLRPAANGCDWASDVLDHDARPLAVIDPEDREQVERMLDLFSAAWSGCEGSRSIAMQAALREFANPTPPKPEEPTGLGAVVEDASGVRWVRTPPGSWYGDGKNYVAGYYLIDAVRVLSEGVES